MFEVTHHEKKDTSKFLINSVRYKKSSEKERGQGIDKETVKRSVSPKNLKLV